MGKKVKEYKAGDFIFAKVKGYPAWPARVQRMNGKKYFVYFYGTGETANLPPNMIFDYAENKDKFLTKTVKRRDFNDGVKQIEHDFANNVPLEQVIGANPEAVPAEGADESVNDTGISETMDDNMDTTNADDTVADTTASNATQNDTAVEDSDETGALVIDEGKQPPKGRKSKVEPKKEPPKTPKTPRGKARKEEDKKDDEEEKKDEEIVSRSGRKIRPKRYMDEQTEENTTLPSPAPKKRRGASPDKEKEKDKQDKEKPAEKTKQFNNVSPAELEDLKEPFKPDSSNKSSKEICITPTPSEKKLMANNGKKKNTSGKTKVKPKKFVPPTKSTYKSEQTKQDCIDNIEETSNKNTLKGNFSKNTTSKDCTSKNTISKEKTNYLLQASKTMNIEQLQCTQENSLIQYDTNLNDDFSNLPTFSATFGENYANFGYLFMDSKIGNTEDDSVIQCDTERREKNHSKKDANIAGVILGSLNVLNDDEFVLSQNLSQKTQSDHSSVKNLSRVQSFCSVTSLNKVYKNLDVNSFENKPKNEDKTIQVPPKDYRIPEGKEYLKLFKNKPIKKKSRKYPPMSIEFGDMGFNKKYSDYIKDVGFVPEEMQGEENDTLMKILEMYPNENEISIKMKLPK